MNNDTITIVEDTYKFVVKAVPGCSDERRVLTVLASHCLRPDSLRYDTVKAILAAHRSTQTGAATVVDTPWIGDCVAVGYEVFGECGPGDRCPLCLAEARAREVAGP